MALLYPRKQTVIIFVACLGMVLGTAYYTGILQKNIEKTDIVTLQKGTEITKKDALEVDSSSFSDWKQQFSDTATTTQRSAFSQKQLTQTDKFGMDFFSRYLELKQANLVDNTEVVNQTAQNLVTTYVNTGPRKDYSAKDLKLIPNPNKENLNAYSLAVSRAISLFRVSRTESTIVKEYLTSSDPKILQDIDPIISSYKQIISALVAIPIPETVVEQHLALVNAYNTLLLSAEDLRAMGSDTVRGLSGVNLHENGAMGIIDSIKALYETLKSFGVIFEPDQDILYALLS